MRPVAHDVNDALPPKMSLNASQGVTIDTLKAPFPWRNGAFLFPGIQ